MTLECDTSNVIRTCLVYCAIWHRSMFLLKPVVNIESMTKQLRAGQCGRALNLSDIYPVK